MFLQVLLLCWLRAIVHYQYAKGGTMLQAARVRQKHVSQQHHCTRPSAERKTEGRKQGLTRAD
jgi:hypothetical protein